MFRRNAPALVVILAAALAGAAFARPMPIAKDASAGAVQLNCDMLTFTGALDRKTERELVPAHSLDAAAAVLNRHNVAFERQRGTLTYGQMPQKLLDRLNQLPPGEPVILPGSGGGAICVLVPGGDTY